MKKTHGKEGEFCEVVGLGQFLVAMSYGGIGIFSSAIPGAVCKGRTERNVRKMRSRDTLPRENNESITPM